MLSNLIRLRLQNVTQKMAFMPRRFITSHPKSKSTSTEIASTKEPTTIVGVFKENPSFIFTFPAIVTGIAFFPYGAYTGYRDSKKCDVQTFPYCVTMSIGGAIIKFSIGFTLGFFWPFTLFVYGLKKYEGEPIRIDSN